MPRVNPTKNSRIQNHKHINHHNPGGMAFTEDKKGGHEHQPHIQGTA